MFTAWLAQAADPIVQLDRSLYRSLHLDARRDWLDAVMVVITDSGLGHVQFGALLVAVVAAKWGPKAGVAWVVLLALGFGIGFSPAVGIAVTLLSLLAWQLTSREAWAAVLTGALAGIVRNLIAHDFGRMRPSNFEFSRPLEQVFGSTSFPSGHATTSFAIAFAIVLIITQPERKWLGAVFGLWAILVGISRVYVGVHYPSDILGAACLGGAVAIVWAIVRRLRAARSAADQAPEAATATQQTR